MRKPLQKLYSTEELDAHFQDAKIPSPSTYKPQLPNPWPSTFHSWPGSDHPNSTCQAAGSFPSSHGDISRIHFFNTKAQPLYPPYIYTRTHLPALLANINRIAPLFRQIGYGSDRKYLFDGYVKIVSVEIVEGKSDELKKFVERKVEVGGLRRERTKEQWEGTLGEDWFKVCLEGVESEMGDPMGAEEVRLVLEMMNE